MKNKLISMLALILVFGLLAACGQAPAQSAPEAGSVAETADAAAAAPAAEAEPAAEPETPAEAESPAEPESAQDSAQEASAVEAPAAEEPEEAPEVFDPETLFTDYLDEPAVSDMYAEVADKFQLLEYTDPATGLTIPYHLFTPEQAETEPCPMIMFIGDATCTGSNTDYSLSQGYGGIIWATESEQAKHPCYVMVPVFPEVIIEDNVNPPYVSEYMDAAGRMVEAVAAENNVDTDRIYTTGQSMGCMTSLYLAAHHPDLFAAELFVSGQWQIDELQGLETQTFFYVAAGGDPKASAGQADVMADLDSKGLSYSVSYDWDANLDDAGLEEALRAEIAEGNAMNFGQFAAGTVTEANPRGMEHMSSFDCAYKIDVLRNWLFAQSK